MKVNNNSPLIYYARHSWFIKDTAFKDAVIKNNNTVNWYPEHIKEGRFLNFLENMIDWAISRDRYWGTPLPIWVCKDCGHHHCVDSIKNLKEMSDNCPEDIEPPIHLDTHSFLSGAVFCALAAENSAANYCETENQQRTIYKKYQT